MASGGARSMPAPGSRSELRAPELAGRPGTFVGRLMAITGVYGVLLRFMAFAVLINLRFMAFHGVYGVYFSGKKRQLF